MFVISHIKGLITQYLNECLEISQQLGEGKLYARCCQQMSQSLQSVGEVERALILLDMFADAANQVKDNELIASSAVCLGELSIARVCFVLCCYTSFDFFNFTHFLIIKRCINFLGELSILSLRLFSFNFF